MLDLWYKKYASTEESHKNGYKYSEVARRSYAELKVKEEIARRASDKKEFMKFNSKTGEYEEVESSVASPAWMIGAKWGKAFSQAQRDL